MARLEHTVPPEATAGRLDKYLVEVTGLSRASVKTAFDEGRVRVDGRPARKGDPLRPGSTVTAEIAAAATAARDAPVAEPGLPLEVLRESQNWVLVNKPAGLAVHPLVPDERGTLANALVARYPECAEASEDPREGGFVHRLDHDTSGVVLAARDPETYRAFREAFRERRVEKRYLALAGGAPGVGGTITLPIAHHPRNARKMVTCASDDEAEKLDARPALTLYRVVEWIGDLALVDVEIPTGARHQIRVHLAAIGAPVVGDSLYGGPALEGLHRHFLHASRLAFNDPATGERVETEAPLAAELSRQLDALRARR